MPPKDLPVKLNLTPQKDLQTLVESKRIFNLSNCEFTIYETYQPAYQVPLAFNDLVITNMICGRKVMHLFDKPSFEYIPGQSMILPAHKPMIIDFPDASHADPTQCVAITIDEDYVNNTLNFLNTEYNIDRSEEHDWSLQFNNYHFDNDAEMVGLFNKLIRVCSSDSPGKNIYADLNLKELLIRLLQSQHLQQIISERDEKSNHSRRHFVLNYIDQHLTEKIAIDRLSQKAYLSRNIFFKWFKQQFGITPVDYINRERIRLAKQLLTDTQKSITEIGLHCGFSDVNYFVRLFRKTEGVTPGSYRENIKNVLSLD